jgi:hypothetical protein
MAGAAVTHSGKLRRRRAYRSAERSQDPARARPSAESVDADALLDRLQDHALGTVDMTSTQVRAAEVALKKSEAADEPESHAVRRTISAEPLSEDEWQRKYAR